MKNRYLILGASSDIGIKLTEYLLTKKIDILAHYCQNIKKLNLLKKKYNNQISLIKFDATKENIEDFENIIKSKFNYKVSSIINLIGYVDNKTYVETNIKETINNFVVNFLFPQAVIKLNIDYMKKIKFGRILNISSIGVKFGGGINNYNYSLSKYASEFVPQYFKKISKDNIFINNLRLGLIDTKLHNKIDKKNMKKRIGLIPIKKIAKPEEIIEIIYYLSSNKNTFVNLETVTVAGGE